MLSSMSAPSPSLGEATFAEEGSLRPISCTIHGGGDAVATAHVSLPAEDGSPRHSRVVPTPIFVKGCESRFNIERHSDIQLCTPDYYREDKESLVWDEQECVIPLSPGNDERRDNSEDLERWHRLDVERADNDPISMAVGKVTSSSLQVIERLDASLVCGDNCLIWCSSVKPKNKAQWAAWWDSLEDIYDDYATIQNPHAFAQSLGAMALQQRGLLGNPISFADPLTGQIVQRRCLPVIYGPVVYVKNRLAYIDESLSEMEFIVRSIFAKTVEHRSQREYRFALLTNKMLEYETLLLRVSSKMRAAMRTNAKADIPPSTLPRTGGSGISVVAPARVSVPLKGSHLRDGHEVFFETSTVEEVDGEAIRRAINEEPTTPRDARIARFTFDAGPDNVFTIYDIEGISGTYRLVNQSGNMALEAGWRVSGAGENRRCLIDLAGFSGTMDLRNGTTRAKLIATTVNPAATVDAELPHDGIMLSQVQDTSITISAMSADGTASSSFEIIFDKNLIADTTTEDSVAIS